jgi:hypothetical protein
VDVSGTMHNVSLEWPGEDDNLTIHEAKPSRTHVFRLVVSNSTVLSSKHKVVLLDGYSELQIGRDASLPGTNVPRVRLKELAVSKLHCIIYWDSGRQEWNIVDMGSKHGTFVRPDCTSSFSRLSQARTSSIPRRLGHLDQLQVGSTTFTVHIHEGHACEECSSAESNEVPLFVTSSLTRQRAQQMKKEVSTLPRTLDSQQALTDLKRQMLGGKIGPTYPSERYIDRSARRRAQFSASHADSPGVRISVPPTDVDAADSIPASSVPAPDPIAPRLMARDPPAPISTSSIGHKLLMKQGWQPGSSLGQEGGQHIKEPLQLTSSVNRSGLGMSAQRSLP